MTATTDGLMPVLAAVDNALRNGSYMTGANLAFDILCDRLGVDRDALVFRPDWAVEFPDDCPNGLPVGLCGDDPDCRRAPCAPDGATT